MIDGNNCSNSYPKKIKKLLISVALVGSLITSGNAALANEMPDRSTNIVYNDFNINEYWANDMLWAIESGLIQGYQNTKHPTNKSNGVGNWLNPNGNLTEAQMIINYFPLFAT